LQVTPAALGRRFSPLVLLVVAQAVLAVAAPSIAPTAGLSSAPSAQGSPSVTGPTGNGSAITTGTTPGTTTGGAPATGSTGGAVSSTSGGTAVGTTGTTGGTGGGQSVRDLSHCDAHGRQIGQSFYMPPCVPVFHGTNGGATMTGVDAKHIKVLAYRGQSNPQLDAILKPAGLATDPDEICAGLVTYQRALEKHWEFYGRTISWVDGPGSYSSHTVAKNGCKGAGFFQSKCSISPPDVPCFRAEADLIATLKPAYVIAPVADQSFESELAKRHIIISGGAVRPQSYFDAQAPYHYDVATGGSVAMAQMASYYCQYMNGRPVQWAGPDVKPVTGSAPQRKVGVIFPATNGDPTYKITADEFAKAITGGRCGSAGTKVIEYPYQSDISTAQQQSTTLAAAMKSDKITTLVWFADALAPVFITSAMGQQNFHPENLITGIQGLDLDSLSRLYDKSVWRYAFGIGEATQYVPDSASEATIGWHMGGGTGNANGSSKGLWNYFVLLADSFQFAGPSPTPDSIRAGLFSVAGRPSNPTHVLFQLGHPNIYTATNDVRSVYWCGSANGPDGQRGTWLATAGGRRYQTGGFPGSSAGIFPNGVCNPT
jgi:hypothetical protein